jgi:hypothetical protein
MKKPEWKSIWRGASLAEETGAIVSFEPFDPKEFGA